jgi:hypothetical protein
MVPSPGSEQRGASNMAVKLKTLKLLSQWICLVFVIYLVSNWVLLVIVVVRTHAGSIRWVAQGRAGCIAYVGGFLTFMSIGGFPSFVEDMKVDLYSPISVLKLSIVQYTSFKTNIEGKVVIISDCIFIC